MANPTVTNTITDSGGNGINNAPVLITLTNLGASTTAFDATTQTEVVSPLSLTTNSSGVWSSPIVPNSLISPANTFYLVTENNSKSYFIQVPNGAGPYWVGNIQVFNPTISTNPPFPAAQLNQVGTFTAQQTFAAAAIFQSVLTVPNQPAPTTAGVSIYSGSGVPSFNAAQGDIYHRTDTPSTANQRIYINTAVGNHWSGIL